MSSTGASAPSGALGEAIEANTSAAVACSAGHAAASVDVDHSASDAGYAAERDFQSVWLIVRLTVV